MAKAVASLTHYMTTYDKQPFYTYYTDETFINDVLYGLGIALSDDYRQASGFDLFKARLREHLK